jgi:uncharacterized protein YciI
MSEPALERLTLVLLRRPADAPELPEAELVALQEQHLAFLRAMRERGVMVTAGPFADQADERLRGICLYRTSLEETRALASQDPAVRAGRMTADVFSWLFPAGEIRFAEE